MRAQVPPQYLSGAYVPALTGLRAFAAMLVLALHATQNFPLSSVSNLDLVQRGYLGVDLFSSYLVS